MKLFKLLALATFASAPLAAAAEPSWDEMPKAELNERDIMVCESLPDVIGFSYIEVVKARSLLEVAYHAYKFFPDGLTDKQLAVVSSGVNVAYDLHKTDPTMSIESLDIYMDKMHQPIIDKCKERVQDLYGLNINL